MHQKTDLDDLTLISFCIDDLTRRTHLGRSTIFVRIAARSLRAYKDGARTFVPHDDLMAYLRARPPVHSGDDPAADDTAPE